MTEINFIKMHGLGNDFVVIDNRHQDCYLDKELIVRIANRRTGIGCDQLIVIDKSGESIADAKMTIFNSDGSEAKACGNASRCVGKLLLNEKTDKDLLLETKGGLVDIEIINGIIHVDMGLAKSDWRDIPLLRPVDTSNLNFNYDILTGGFAVNIGNPHVVFFNNELDKNKLTKDCEVISKLDLFKEGVNINIAKIVSRNHIKLIVFERGCGFTPACGSGACATLAAAVNLNKVNKRVKVSMDGGDLEISFLNDGHLLMSGPAEKTYEGKLTLTDKI